MSEYKTDIDIAREVSGEHINDIGAKLKIDKSDLVPFGHDKAKISWNAIDSVQKNKDGKLILPNSVNRWPSPAKFSIIYHIIMNKCCYVNHFNERSYPEGAFCGFTT